MGVVDETPVPRPLRYIFDIIEVPGSIGRLALSVRNRGRGKTGEAC